MGAIRSSKVNWAGRGIQNVFPIEDSHRNYILSIKTITSGDLSILRRGMDRGVTYSAPLRVRLALHITDENNKMNMLKASSRMFILAIFRNMTKRYFYYKWC